MAASNSNNRLPEDYIQRVMEAVDITDVINQYVPLKKSGPREMVGCCPFHKEKTPSFSVSPAKGLYLCRGCGEGGNAVKFLQKHAGMEFLEALETLAGMAGMPRPSEVRATSGDKTPNDEYKQLQHIVQRAAELYQAELARHPQARAYLHSRGVNDELIQEFGLGFAPGRRFLLSQLKEFRPELLVKAGVAGRDDKSDSFHDFMSQRVVFPIRNLSGKLVALGGRVLDDHDTRARYINTPETALFRKGHELYGWSDSRHAISVENKAIVFEGYLDKMAAHAHGLCNTVSTMGATAQSSALARMMKSAEHLVFCFKDDAAGQRAARRAMDEALPVINETHSASFLFLPQGHDADSYLKAHGKEAFEALAAKAVPLSQFLLRDAATRHDLGVSEGRTAYAAEVMACLNRISAPLLRAVFIGTVREKMGPHVQLEFAAPQPAVASAPAAAPVGSRRSLFANRQRPQPQAAAASAPAPVVKSPSPPGLTLRVVGLLLQEPLAAGEFNPKWVESDPHALPEEVDCVYAIIEAARTAAGQRLDLESLKARCGSPIAEVIDRARSLPEVGDPVEELGSLAHHLVDLAERKRQHSRMFGARP